MAYVGMAYNHTGSIPIQTSMPVVGDVVGVSVGVSELNSDSLVGIKVGNEVAASITTSQLCALGVDMCKDVCTYM